MSRNLMSTAGISPRHRHGTHLAPLLLAMGLLGLPLAAAGQERVTLQLKWTHGFQFAGYYAAVENGYYREAGLDVAIKEAGPGVNPVDEVCSRRAEYGVGTSSVLLSRADGSPVVVLAVIYQHSALALAMRLADPNKSIHDIVGKRVMLEPQSEELYAYLKAHGIDPGDITTLEHSMGLEEFLAGTIDAFSIYTTTEPYWLDRAGAKYIIGLPRAAGIDFYGDNLFTSEAELKAHPGRAAAFREASLRGWRWALDNVDEAMAMVLRSWSPGADRDHVRYTAERLAELVHADLMEPGHMNPARWRHIAGVYADLGMLPADYDLSGLLYRTPEPYDPRRLHLALALAVAATGLVSLVLAVVAHINRRLKAMMVQGEASLHALEESEERFRALMEGSAAGMYLLRGLRFIMVNKAMSDITGYSQDELLAMRQLEFVHEDMREDVRRRAIARQKGSPEPVHYEVKLATKDGKERWIELSASLVKLEGETTIIGTVYDITERKRNAELVEHMAKHDGLTGLANRELFFDRLGQALALARRERTGVALVFLDLDGFKPVNDEFGHAVGDEALKETARRIRSRMRASDVAGRIGGDEFLAFLYGVEAPGEARSVAAKILESIETPYGIEGRTIALSASIGIALYPGDAADVETLVLRADEAMYRAKKGGKARIELYGSA